MDELANLALPHCIQQVFRSHIVHRPEEFAILCKRDLCDVVKYDFDALAGISDGFGLPDVATHERDFGWPVSMRSWPGQFPPSRPVRMFLIP